MIIFDTETCGLHGPIVLIQYAYDDGPVILHNPWMVPIGETMELLLEFCTHEGGVCGFNLVFDWFHVCQMYTTLQALVHYGNPKDTILGSCVNAYANCEADARFGDCMKPVTALDLMLHARKGPYQSTMNRADIKIKRVPTLLAEALANELTKRIKLKDVYFARKKDYRKRWQVEDIENEKGDMVPDFKDIVLRFAPSSALKALAEDALGVDTKSVTRFAAVEVHKDRAPVEYGYAPYATAVGSEANWKGAWPDVISTHIQHWEHNELARQYAEDDVTYTRMLYEYFGKPAAGDNDSILACMVGAVRWRGYSINVEKIKALRADAVQRQHALGFNFNSPAMCRKYVTDAMSDTEAGILVVDGKVTTKAVILESVAGWTASSVCTDCNGMGCGKCEDGLIESEDPHLAATRARGILNARHAAKEVELFDKLLTANRFHTSFVVIGTKSSRMAGADKLNPQGIKRGKEVRSSFPLADGDLILCGGDFKSFEVGITAAVYPDKHLIAQLKTGKKIHGIWGQKFFPTLSYDEIMASKGAEDPWRDYYTRSKNGVFALIYFGTEYTLQTRVGLGETEAIAGYAAILEEYPDFAEQRKVVVKRFCSMQQPAGIGTKVEWHEPEDFVESIFGFRRYFTLENQICRVLFELAEDPPKAWTRLKIKTVRRERVQTVSGAARSALFAAAFAVQSANMRAAGNHIIQCTGAETNKELQCRLWSLQPAGITKWHIQPMNIHDEIMAPMLPECIPEANRIVTSLIDEYKKHIPLIGIDWGDHLESWASK